MRGFVYQELDSWLAGVYIGGDHVYLRLKDKGSGVILGGHNAPAKFNSYRNAIRQIKHFCPGLKKDKPRKVSWGSSFYMIGEE